tara:strand:+ start:447 stop:713 length:267 start_codon:yes stop_codon:yes gene_type:complete
MQNENENKVGFGKLEKNPDKTPKDKRPDLKGYVNFNGTFYNAAAWVKKGDDGKPFYQMSIEKQQQKKDNVDAGKPDLVVNDDFNELPF